MESKLEYVSPNEKMLDVILLHLEKYEHLEPEDRKLYRKVIEALVRPPIVCTPGRE